MKRFLLLALALFLMSSAVAEGDFTAWEGLPDTSVYLDDDGITTVIRALNQPYFGQMEGDALTVCAFIDYVEDAYSDLVLLRLSIAPESSDPLYAEEMILIVGKQRWHFPVSAYVTEYDMIYQEDYAVCLTDESLSVLTAYIRAKADSLSFALIGQETWQGVISLPVADVKALYDTYVRLGGTQQPLSGLRERYPCDIN